MTINSRSAVQKRRYLLASLGLALLFAGFSLFASPASWPHDDWDISLVLMQRFGSQNTIWFVNIILCWIVKALCFISMNINWFFWLRLLFTTLSFAVFTYCALLNLPLFGALAVDGLFKFTFWQVCAVQMNFTRNAGLFAAAGLALLALFVQRKGGRWTLFTGFLLWFMGTLWRPKAGLLVLPFALVLLLMAWLRPVQSVKDLGASLKALLKNRQLQLAAGGVLLITVTAWSAQTIYWNQPQWNEFQSCGYARSGFMDYGSGNWEEMADVLEEAGISENDLWCLEHQISADPEFFDQERFELLAQSQKEKLPMGEFLTQSAIPFLLKLPFQVKSFLAFSLMAAFLFLLGDWKQRIAIVCAWGGSLVICLGVLWAAYLPERVMEAIFVSGMFSILVLGARTVNWKHVWTKRAALVGGAAVFAACIAVTGLRMSANLSMPRVNTIENGKTGSEAVDTAALDKEHVYLWNIYSAITKVQNAYGLTALPEPSFFQNNTLLGGYHEHSPYMTECRRNMGAENPMRALVENPKVLLADDYEPERILRYVQEHYQEDAALSSAKKLGDFWALKITPPLAADEKQPMQWKIGALEHAPTSRDGWYTIEGQAQGLPQDTTLWLKASRADGESRVYQLVRGEGDAFFGGLYFDWADPEELTFTLMWEQSDRMVESETSV